jgi:hypothetical protein
MAQISDSRIETAQRASKRANRLGQFTYNIARVVFWLLTIGVVIGLYGVYNENDYFVTNSSGAVNSYTDWDNVWVGWGILIGIWMIYSFCLAMVALVCAVEQTKAESLEIQITQAQP